MQSGAGAGTLPDQKVTSTKISCHSAWNAETSADGHQPASIWSIAPFLGMGIAFAKSQVSILPADDPKCSPGPEQGPSPTKK